MCNMSFLLIMLCFYFELTLSNYRLTWSDYRKINNLKFRTMAKNRYQRKIYMENLAKIEEHNDKFRKGVVPYSMKINQFGHLTEEEFIEKYTGLAYFEENNHRNLDDYFYYAPKDVTLPEAVDWRLQGAVTPVNRQSGCSACYVFSTVGTIESHYYIKSNKSIILSKQQLIDCGRNYTMFGCRGGSLEGAFDYMIKFGLTTESAYPYESLSGPCRLGKHPIEVKLKSYKKVKKGSVYDMEAAVAFEGPVTAPVNSMPLKFITGNEILIGNWCINNTKHHAVIVVGYNTTPEGLNYWIIKNSWGENWGDNGYFYLERHKDDLCGLTSQTFIPYLK